MIKNFQNIAYITSDMLLKQCNKIQPIINRAPMVHELINSYGILRNLNVLQAIPATEEELCEFHSKLYIDYLNTLPRECKDDWAGCEEPEAASFGIGYDCPLVDDIFDLVSWIAGGTITAAKALTTGNANIAINWCGGWHHAQRDRAEGYCYINDVVLAIEHMRKTFEKILYIDLDVHHGNGVENAYYCTNKVCTLSLHEYEEGFYPLTGALNDIGVECGRHYTINVPLREGINDDQYLDLFKCISEKVITTFKPDAMVVQCGADCLSGDVIGDFNLTPTCLGSCVKHLLSWKIIPTLFVGGGGYNIANTARCWTYLTSVIAGITLENDIPDNEYFMEYGPDFTLSVMPSNRKNLNTEERISKIITTIIDNLKNMEDNADSEDETTAIPN